VNQWEVEIVFDLEAACRRQLRQGIVEPYGTTAGPRHPRGDVSGSAAGLEYVAILELWKEADLAFGDSPETP